MNHEMWGNTQVLHKLRRVRVQLIKNEKMKKKNIMKM